MGCTGSKLRLSVDQIQTVIRELDTGLEKISETLNDIKQCYKLYDRSDRLQIEELLTLANKPEA